MCGPSLNFHSTATSEEVLGNMQIGTEDERQGLLQKPAHGLDKRAACWFVSQLVGGTLALFVLGALVVVVHNPEQVGKMQAKVPRAQNLKAIDEDSGLHVYADTECGKVKGVLDASASLAVYKGIPYAHSSRWKPPVGVAEKQQTCWKGDVLDATKFGPVCMQERNPMLDTMDVPMSEDCLVLNVWTPQQARPDTGRKLPVIFFIHGGSLEMGHSSWAGMTPWPMAETDQVVIVSVNYRLSSFGWLAVDGIHSSTTAVKANYGLLDLMEGLKWVRRNIEGFGGDHRAVTIMGQSSGGTLVNALVGSPLAKGLFHRAVSMSGSPVLRHTAEEASELQMERFVSATTCKGKAGPELSDCMHALPAEDLVKAIPPGSMSIFQLPGETTDSVLPWLVIDGFSQTSDFETALKQAQVPIVFGEMREEAAILPFKSFASNATEADAAKYIATTLAAVVGEQEGLADRVLELYQRLQPAQELYSEVTTDVRMYCPVSHLARTTAQSSMRPVYMYQSAYRLQKPLLFPGMAPIDFAFHSQDLMLLSYRHGSPPLSSMQLTDIKAKMILQAPLLHFAWTGSVPAWEEMGMGEQYVVNRIGDGRAAPSVRYAKALGEGKCAFWNSFKELAPYAWIN